MVHRGPCAPLTLETCAPVTLPARAGMTPDPFEGFGAAENVIYIYGSKIVPLKKMVLNTKPYGLVQDWK